MSERNRLDWSPPAALAVLSLYFIPRPHYTSLCWRERESERRGGGGTHVWVLMGGWGLYIGQIWGAIPNRTSWHLFMCNMDEANFHCSCVCELWFFVLCVWLKLERGWSVWVYVCVDKLCLIMMNLCVLSFFLSDKRALFVRYFSPLDVILFKKFSKIDNVFFSALFVNVQITK